MQKKLVKLLKSLQDKGVYPNELNEFKFFPELTLKKLHYSDNEIECDWAPHFDSVREKVLKIIINYSDGVFAGILNKTDNYGKNHTAVEIGNTIFKESLVDHILPKLDYPKDLHVIYDRGRLGIKKTKEFDFDIQQSTIKPDATFTDYYFKPKTFHDVDSKYLPGIWASDFIAGAFNLAYKDGNTKFIDRLKPKFIGKGFKEFKFE